MATLKFRNPLTGQFESLAFVAKGDKGDKGDPGPPGSAGPLEELTDVSNAVSTPAGKVLGTVGTGDWQPVDHYQGDVEEAPQTGATYGRNDAAWTQLSHEFLLLSGGTLTGMLTLAEAPSSGMDAANKGYVDSRIWTGTQAQYDAIGTKDPEVLYVVTG